jgi:hypothetical protein
MGDISLRGRGIVRVGLAKGGMTKSQKTVKTAMSKFKKGTLHSGSKKGPVVKSRKQAIAIALSEAGKSKTPRKKFKIGGIIKGLKKSKKVKIEDFSKADAKSRSQSELIKKFNDKTITQKEKEALEQMEIMNITE